MQDGVATTSDKGDIYTLWLNTIESPSRRVVGSTGNRCTGLVSRLCKWDLLHALNGKAGWHPGEYIRIKDPVRSIMEGMTGGFYAPAAIWYKRCVLCTCYNMDHMFLVILCLAWVQRKRSSLKQKEEGKTPCTLTCFLGQVMLHALLDGSRKGIRTHWHSLRWAAALHTQIAYCGDLWQYRVRDAGTPYISA